jgi:hypothetical protein
MHDNVIYMPYYNDYNKGTSLIIERKTKKNSITSTIQVWNATKPNNLGAKEIVLYIHKGIDRLAAYKD